MTALANEWQQQSTLLFAFLFPDKLEPSVHQAAKRGLRTNTQQWPHDTDSQWICNILFCEDHAYLYVFSHQCVHFVHIISLQRTAEETDNGIVTWWIMTTRPEEAYHYSLCIEHCETNSFDRINYVSIMRLVMWFISLIHCSKTVIDICAWALIAAWLNASQATWDGVQVNNICTCISGGKVTVVSLVGKVIF